MGSGAPRSRPGLSRESLDLLLATLDPVRERAGERYEGIRSRLVRFFLCRGLAQPEELADDTIDRVCRRLVEGEEIRAVDVARYFLGVARNVAREAWDLDQRRRASGATQEMARRSLAAADEPDQGALACLEQCLETLPPEARDLVLRYYDSEPSTKVERRRALASQLGIAPNALRIRLHRLRAQLERCIRRCLRARNETSSFSQSLSSRGEDS
jgi:DNA-directed RNA polymerase specialized sigma24 family protein